MKILDIMTGKLKPTSESDEESPIEILDLNVNEQENFMNMVDSDSLHSLFPFSWEQYPTYVQSGENFIRVIAVTDYPKRVYGNWLSELKRKKGTDRKSVV